MRQIMGCGVKETGWLGQGAGGDCVVHGGSRAVQEGGMQGGETIWDGAQKTMWCGPHGGLSGDREDHVVGA